MADFEQITDTSHYAECLTRKQKIKRNHMLRMLMLAILGIANGYIHIIGMPLTHAESEGGFYGTFIAGTFLAVIAIIYCVIVLVLALLGTPENPKLMYAAIVVFLLGLLIRLMNPAIAIIYGIIFAWAFLDIKTAKWLRTQPGYPHFSERLTQQDMDSMRGYQSRYDIRNTKPNAEMQEIGAEMLSVDDMFTDN